MSNEVESTETLRLLIPSPLGDLGIELVDGKVAGVVIAPDEAARATYTDFVDLEASDFLDEVLGRFSEYFAGARRRLELGFSLGPSGVTGFPRRVLKETAKIPYGRTRTYQEIAKAAGNPDGYRVVLSVLVSNPLPIVVPCHRVVTNKSGVGSYIAGEERKKWLLTMESSATPPPAPKLG